MQNSIHKPTPKKLFSNKLFTYIVTDNNGHGRVVEMEIKVVGRRISYTYTNIRERNAAGDLVL